MGQVSTITSEFCTGKTKNDGDPHSTSILVPVALPPLGSRGRLRTRATWRMHRTKRPPSAA